MIFGFLVVFLFVTGLAIAQNRYAGSTNAREHDIRMAIATVFARAR